mgnify:CR=1 FL=1
MGLLDTAYDELRKPRALGLRVGDFVPYVSGLLAADDARLAAKQGNYGEAAGALAGLIPGGAIAKKLTGVDLGSVSPRQIFAGKKAKGADLEAMKRAESRVASGDDPRTVWREEGWFRGPDGQMRFEIDDSGLQINDYRNTGGAISISHPELAKAYPPVRNMKATPHPMFSGRNAGYDPFKDDLDYRLGNPGKIYIGDKAPPKDVFGHELQHFTQQVEGFAKGGGKETPEVLAEARRMVAREKATGRTDLPPDDEFMNMAKTNAYRRLAGEAEARAVQKRINMTPEERRNTYPNDSYDVPINSLIYTGLLD